MALFICLNGSACSAAPAGNTTRGIQNQPAQSKQRQQQQQQQQWTTPQLKSEMIASFNHAKWVWCRWYATKLAAQSTDQEEKALAEYYNGNSLIKGGAYYMAEQAYERAKTYTTDPAMVKNCEQGITSSRVMRIENTSQSYAWLNAEPTRGDASVDAMIDRERDQLARSAGANGRDPQTTKEFAYFLPKYREYMSRIEALESQIRDLSTKPRTPENAAQKDLDLRSIDYIKKQLDNETQYSPAFKAFLLRLDQFKASEKEALSSKPSLNTVPKLQTIGSDYYTKNYGAASTQAVAKPADASELVATPKN